MTSGRTFCPRTWITLGPVACVRARTVVKSRSCVKTTWELARAQAMIIASSARGSPIDAQWTAERDLTPKHAATHEPCIYQEILVGLKAANHNRAEAIEAKWQPEHEPHGHEHGQVGRGAKTAQYLDDRFKNHGLRLHANRALAKARRGGRADRRHARAGRGAATPGNA